MLKAARHAQLAQRHLEAFGDSGSLGRESAHCTWDSRVHFVTKVNLRRRQGLEHVSQLLEGNMTRSVFALYP